METGRKVCRLCKKIRKCENLDNKFYIGKHVWGRGGVSLIYGFWICKKCKELNNGTTKT